MGTFQTSDIHLICPFNWFTINMLLNCFADFGFMYCHNTTMHNVISRAGTQEGKSQEEGSKESYKEEVNCLLR